MPKYFLNCRRAVLGWIASSSKSLSVHFFSGLLSTASTRLFTSGDKWLGELVGDIVCRDDTPPAALLCRLKKLAIFLSGFRWGGTAKDAGGLPQRKNPLHIANFFNQHVVIVVPLSAIFNHLAHPPLFYTYKKYFVLCTNI